MLQQFNCAVKLIELKQTEITNKLQRVDKNAFEELVMKPPTFHGIQNVQLENIKAFYSNMNINADASSNSNHNQL